MTNRMIWRLVFEITGLLLLVQGLVLGFASIPADGEAGYILAVCAVTSWAIGLVTSVVASVLSEAGK